MFLILTEPWCGEMGVDGKKPYVIAVIIQLIYTGMFVVSKAAFNRGMNTYANFIMSLTFFCGLGGSLISLRYLFLSCIVCPLL